MINAHTATRTFRELQFDIKAFLYALYDIFPAEGHEDKGLVEIKWADGSVDIVPTFELVKGICNSTYMKLLIGEVAELLPDVTSVPIQNGKYYKDTLNLIIQSAPLKAHMEEIGSDSEDLEFIYGTIQKLVADTVELPSNAEISKMTVNGKLYTSECHVDSKARMATLVCNGDVVGYGSNSVNSMHVDLSKATIAVPMRVLTPDSEYLDMSQFRQIYHNNMVRDRYQVTGQFRLGDSFDSVSVFQVNTPSAGMVVEIPVYHPKYGDILGFDFVRTSITPFSVDRQMPFPITSPPALMMLYPLKTVEVLGEGRLCVKVHAPKSTDAYSIINIQNPTGSYVTACNAWSFGDDTASLEGSVDRSPIGVVNALNTIHIPPYAAIDFLFIWEIKGGRLYAYMLPMTSANLKVRVGW